MKAVKFFNYSDREFVGRWDSVDYPVAAGEIQMFPAYLAEHFAKHLADMVMNIKGVPTDHFTRPSYVQRALIETAVQAPNAEKLGVEILNQQTGEPAPQEPDAPKRFCDTCDSKGMRHKKECPKYEALQPKGSASA